MPTGLVVPLIHVCTGLSLFILGYLMKVKQWSWLISGYNTSSAAEKAKYDTTALCNGVGNFMFVLGFTQVIASIGFFLRIGWIAAAGWILFTAATVGFLIYANTGGRYRT